MVFLKPLEKLKFSDIERLKTNKICESPILDYKKQLLDDNKLLKHVSAFANTQGGFLIFGVEETGRGGHPKEILGIDKNQLNKERIEQIILGNIQPRLNTKIIVVNHKNPSKGILVIEIPNSHLKPHMNGRDNKFYRRHNFQALPMSEMEVNDTYKRRFTSYQEIENYVSELLTPEEFVMPQIIGQIIVIPTILNRIIDTANINDFAWLNELTFKPKGLYLPSRPTPSPRGIKCQLKTQSGLVQQKLEIHRNGCVHYFHYFGDKDDRDKLVFVYNLFCLKLLHTLQFASALYQKYNYFGDVKILCDLKWLRDSYLIDFQRNRALDGYPCQINELTISREFPTTMVESKYEYITSGIMDEIFNCYGLWKCPLFDDEGNLKELR